MSSVQDIYNQMFAGDTVRVRVGTKSSYETLRTGLCKKNSFMQALDMTALSVVATWREVDGIAEFKLAESSRKQKQGKWEIL